MFESPTVFILGAGASNELDLPIGARLNTIIANKLRQTSGVFGIHDQRIQQAIEIHSNKTGDSFDEFMRAAWRISQAMTFSSSIDAYMDTHMDDPCIQL